MILRIAGPVAMLHPGDMVRVPESAPVLTVDEVESVRSRLRRSDEESRRAALAAIDGWDELALAAIAMDRDVAIVGAGLTAIDVLTVLRARGFSGKVTLISRHGLMPFAHF
ncbi:MAG TPA: hypothetical protein PKB00_16445, partial [Microthrixaceae bacterium]|nr:hypothetical protein [Microthrixaceae bacterium]